MVELNYRAFDEYFNDLEDALARIVKVNKMIDLKDSWLYLFLDDEDYMSIEVLHYRYPSNILFYTDKLNIDKLERYAKLVFKEEYDLMSSRVKYDAENAKEFDSKLKMVFKLYNDDTSSDFDEFGFFEKYNDWISG